MALAGSKLTGAGVRIPRTLSSVGGDLLTSVLLAMNNAVGETAIHESSGGTFKLSSGLMNILAQPGSVTAITAVTKSTGTLDLAWAAPGLDGFQGAVTGFYRIDYSSDPLHVFDPTLFKTEFSTTVTPGQAQSLRVAGLLANTTYYSKIYLADARKYFAEDSKRGDESTLANIPVDPVLANIGVTSVTITWTLPNSGAEGFRMDSSTTSFGSLLPGGAVITSATPNGLQVSLTMNGLAPETTYFFKVASLNWQGDKNFTTVLAARTRRSNAPLGVLNLAALPDSLSRTVSVTWTNPNFDNQQGVVVLLSTSAVSPSVADGLVFTPGQTLGDSSIVKSNLMGTSFNDAGLVLDTTYFYHL